MWKILPLATLLFLNLTVNAAGIEVEWYQPFHYSPPLANHAGVILFGRAQEGATVSIDKNLVVTENPALMESFAELQKADVLQAVADKDGYFQLSLTLPPGLVQLPISFTKEDQTVTYVASLQVSKDKVTISVPVKKDTEQIETRRAQLRRFVARKYGLGLPLANQLTGLWLAGGIGVTYQILSQSLASNTNLKFQSFDLPSFDVRATWNQPRWLVNFNYQYEPGKVSKVSAPFSIRNAGYVWSSFLIEAGYNWRNEYFGERSRFTWLLGIQQHQMPSFRVNFGNEIQNQSLNIATLSAGPMFVLEMGKKFMLEVFMHYQQNISASTFAEGEFKVSPRLSFDGSVGSLYKIGAKDFLGLYWFGQWHQYNISFVNPVDQLTNSGIENLFYSSLDFRYVRHF